MFSIFSPPLLPFPLFLPIIITITPSSTPTRVVGCAVLRCIEQTASCLFPSFSLSCVSFVFLSLSIPEKFSECFFATFEFLWLRFFYLITGVKLQGGHCSPPVVLPQKIMMIYVATFFGGVISKVCHSTSRTSGFFLLLSLTFDDFLPFHFLLSPCDARSAVTFIFFIFMFLLFSPFHRLIPRQAPAGPGRHPGPPSLPRRPSVGSPPRWAQNRSFWYKIA